MFPNPHQRAGGQQIKQRDQIRVGQMNAALRGLAAKRLLIGRAVNIDISIVRIDITAAIEARLKPVQPQDAGRDLGVGKPGLRGVADDFAAFEDRARRFVRPDLFRNPVQAQWGAPGIHHLPDPILRSGTGKQFQELKTVIRRKRRRDGVFKQCHRLAGNIDGEQKLRWRHRVFLAGSRKIDQGTFQLEN